MIAKLCFDCYEHLSFFFFLQLKSTGFWLIELKNNEISDDEVCIMDTLLLFFLFSFEKVVLLIFDAFVPHIIIGK